MNLLPGFAAFGCLAACQVLRSIFVLGLLLGGYGAVGQDPKSSGEAPFRIGFSSGTFGEVNENDASAAVRVWAQALAKERGIPADPQPKILRSLVEMEAALTNKLVDAVNMTTEEYWFLKGRVALQDCVVAMKANLATEEYVLLVHRASGIEQLSGLRGRKLGLLQSSRASLAPAWIDTVLAKEGLGPTTAFYGSVTSAAKVTKVVLPVFFRQLDACVVTRSGFNLMIELNPQLGQQLKIIATSPPMVPVVFCFRADYTSVVRDKVRGEIARWHTTPVGRQILTLFQTDSLEERPLSCLDSALELLAARQRLCTPTGGIEPAGIARSGNGGGN